MKETVRLILVDQNLFDYVCFAFIGAILGIFFGSIAFFKEVPCLYTFVVMAIVAILIFIYEISIRLKELASED